MSLTVANLNLPADKLAQFAAVFGDTGGQNAALQTYCTAADADVARMTAGYVLDPNSVIQMGKSLALYRAYADTGSVPPEVKTNYDDAWAELQAIAKGQRPNLPKQADPALQSRAGAAGSARRIHGRMGCGGPGGSAW